MSAYAEKRKTRLDVFVPSSYVDEVPHLREKTAKIGLLGRALAIYRVSTLILFDEAPGKGRRASADLIKELLDYLNTAPYLRKKLYPMEPSLKYAGLLPPLNIPTHPQTGEEGSAVFPQVREGLVVKGGKRPLIEAGLPKPFRANKSLKPKKRVLVEVQKKGEKSRMRILSKRKTNIYTGFKTAFRPGKLEPLIRRYSLSVAASRLGVSIRNVLEELSARVRGSGEACVAFGSYEHGLHEIAKRHGFDLEDVFTYVINTIPRQGVKTVRTEEAVYSTLSLINTLMD